jgi:hephaestin
MRVVFKNAASMPFSMHPHGVFYDKDQEGAAYAGIPINGSGAGVEPGDTHEYVWPAVERYVLISGYPPTKPFPISGFPPA